MLPLHSCSVCHTSRLPLNFSSSVLLDPLFSVSLFKPDISVLSYNSSTSVWVIITKSNSLIRVLKKKPLRLQKHTKTIFWEIFWISCNTVSWIMTHRMNQLTVQRFCGLLWNPRWNSSWNQERRRRDDCTVASCGFQNGNRVRGCQPDSISLLLNHTSYARLDISERYLDTPRLLL